MINVGDVGVDLDFRVDFAQMVFRGHGFRQTLLGVALGEHRLALQV